MTENPLTVIAKWLGCTPEDVADMNWHDIAAARAKAQREADQVNADLAWLNAASAVLDNPNEQP